MGCYEPVTIKNKATDQYIGVPCGKCIGCLKAKRGHWTYRLKQELKNSESAFFITLTYADEHLPGDGSVNVKDLQLFIKRLRKSLEHSEKNDLPQYGTIPSKNEKVSLIERKGAKKGIRYFLVSEYGPQTLRPHYHGIIFNLPFDTEIKAGKELIDSWHKGFVTIGRVSDARINYCAKYCISKYYFIPEGKLSPFRLCRLGLEKVTLLTPCDSSIRKVR